jgi:hypothetical protein
MLRFVQWRIHARRTDGGQRPDQVANNYALDCGPAGPMRIAQGCHCQIREIWTSAIKVV